MAPSSTPSTYKATAQSIEAEKRWTQRLNIFLSPFWIIAVAFAMLSGIMHQWNDIDYLLFSIAVATPPILFPALLSKKIGRPWYRRYWFKLNVWVAVMVCLGTYFTSHYFFDLMGMRYKFPCKWNFSSGVVGRTGGQVPVFLYPLTHAYFMTYYTVLMVLKKEIVQRLRPGRFGRVVVIVALSYGVALGETFFMASPLLSEWFYYEKRDRMMTVGSVGYMAFFVTGLPMVGRVDGKGEDWPLSRVVIEALGTFMSILVLFEVWAKVVGPL
ncbi:hypothetical protein FPOAC2_10619 [Fusarium poae]|jgi:cycloeucalenol cycloisomerase|uniref:hypothetical protein n=1 Tax=Fusarium poae TaxID=36050 RepID=UPI001CE8B299|nr:hypothetical protein FPOAC1_010342 [Fusarium poae]KAG8665545.1 hypothetical protein FPOAC1_010342 [Fusarium poae]